MKDADLIERAHAWDAAMLANDPVAIRSFMADDWTIVGADGSVGGRDRLLALIASGDLVHHTMTSEELIVRVYGDSGIVIAKGVSAGTYRGAPFREEERSSNVFIRREGQWLCVLTHLSKMAAPKDLTRSHPDRRVIAVTR